MASVFSSGRRSRAFWSGGKGPGPEASRTSILDTFKDSIEDSIEVERAQCQGQVQRGGNMGEVLLAWRGLLGSGVDAILREVPVRLDTSLVSSSDRCKLGLGAAACE